MKKLIYFLFVCYPILILGQQIELSKSEIIDSVYVSKGSKESYALYIPNQFDNSKLSPIVFIFEPMARGKIGIHPFIKAAEEYGYILVCSNNSRNGPFNQNFKIANRLFEKVFSDFSIDPKRIYTAGFSGGARLASTIAILTQQIQGVIACGAAFSSYQIGFPDTIDFSYAAIIGDEDMNLLEMYKTKDYITELKVSNQLFVYEMNHKWPSQDQTLFAFDWLEIEAYRKAIIPINKIKIKTIYTSYYEKAKKLEIDNNLLFAVDEYQRIIKTFDKYFKLDSITNTLNKLNKNKKLKKEKKELKSIFEKEIILRNMFSGRFGKDIDKKNINLKWWESEINKLKKEETSAKSNKKKMFYRLMYNIFSMAIETVNFGEGASSIDQAIFCYDICLIVYPKYKFLYYKQAENYIFKENPEKALDYLEKLISLGYNNMKAIKENKAFDSLKNNIRFIELTKI